MRIRQEHTFLAQLLANLKAGLLLPAGFQRPYVWDRPDCLAFYESILRGYPVGSFLCWLPSRSTALADVARQRLGPVNAGERQPFSSLLLLDGQNRLATLAWLAHDWSTPVPVDPTPHERSVWCNGERLVVDLQAERLRFVPIAEADTGFKLPSAALLDSRLANPLIRDRWRTTWAAYDEAAIDKGLRWFDRAQGSFRDARIVAALLEDASPEEARDAFLHICRVGVPMSTEDFDAALNWAAPA